MKMSKQYNFKNVPCKNLQLNKNGKIQDISVNKKRKAEVEVFRRNNNNVKCSASTKSLEQNQKCQTMKALKELAVVCAALKNGDQTVIFRKGVIREPGFKTDEDEFLLFPTGFHENQHLWKPQFQEKYSKWMSYDPKLLQQLKFDTYCKVTGVWDVKDENLLTVLDDFHICSQNFSEQRLKWRKKQPVTVMELRCYEIAPVELMKQEEWFGCFSWVDVPVPDKIQVGQSIIQDEEFGQRQEDLRNSLSKLQGIETV